MENLFGEKEPDMPKKRPENHKAVLAHKKLLQLHGEVNERCKNCAHFGRKLYGGTYFKCLIATPNWQGHAATDWRANWKACGKFKKDEEN